MHSPPNAGPGSPPMRLAIMAVDGRSTRCPHSYISIEVARSENRACAIGLRSSSGRPQVPQREKWGRRAKRGSRRVRNSTFIRGPKSTESNKVRVLSRERVIEGRSRGTIVLTTHLSGVVLRRSPAALSGVSLGYKTSKVSHTAQQQC